MNARSSSRPRSVELSRRRILVDGEPTLVLAGEIHYFRLSRNEWTDRLEQLLQAGANAVGAYMPWLWHELPDRTIDLTGRSRPERDLGAFLDLCASYGLWVIARPGPFVMAELKNEGLPFSVYEDHPDVLPVSWAGATVPTRTVDYLAPDYLREVARWYAAVMPVLTEHLAPRGGPVIAVQLDNEIGMLSWVTNAPDLTDLVCADLAGWAIAEHGAAEAAARVGADPTDLPAWTRALRVPGEEHSLRLHHDLGRYMRDRFRRYVAALREQAEVNGVRDVPFLINVHGTSDGRGRTFPIGISQLAESYRGQPQMTSGSDHYLGDLTVSNVADVYLMNAFMLAAHDADQPLTSVEFEAGNGNYNDDLAMLVPPEAVELKTRLCVAQGNRLINYYLFAGGVNPPLDALVGDGNDRIAFTGEEHGFAAPVGPTGRQNATFAATARAIEVVQGAAELLADMDEEHDGLAIGLVPDHYLTEYRAPGSVARAAQVRELERYRGAGPRDALGRGLLLAGFSFPAVDLQSETVDLAGIPVLVVASPPTMARRVQERLAGYVTGGGRLLLSGVLPAVDHDGLPCTVLADALGLRSAGRLDSTPSYFTSVVAHGWAAPRVEVRVGYAVLLEPTGSTSPETVLVEKGSGSPCAVTVAVGSGVALVVTCEDRFDTTFVQRALGWLGAEPRWFLDASAPGTVVTSTADRTGQRLLHLLGIAPYAVDLRITHRGVPLLGGLTLHVPARTGLMLPLGVRLDGALLVDSTAELVERSADLLVVRPTQPEDVVRLETRREVEVDGGTVERTGDLVTVRSVAGERTDDVLRLHLR